MRLPTLLLFLSTALLAHAADPKASDCPENSKNPNHPCLVTSKIEDCVPGSLPGSAPNSVIPTGQCGRCSNNWQIAMGNCIKSNCLVFKGDPFEGCPMMMQTPPGKIKRRRRRDGKDEERLRFERNNMG